MYACDTVNPVFGEVEARKKISVLMDVLVFKFYRYIGDILIDFFLNIDKSEIIQN